MLAQFDGVPPAPGVSASDSAAEQRARVDSLFALGLRSLQRSKELLQQISTDQSRSAADEAAGYATPTSFGSGIPARFIPRLSCAIPSASIKSLLRVCVTNSLLAISYKKSVAAASAVGAALQLEMKWERYGGNQYTPLHADRKVPFPVLSLRMRPKANNA